MLRPIIGVVAGNVFDTVVSSLVGAIILTLTYAFALRGDANLVPHAELESIAHSARFLVLAYISGSIVSTSAGYVAAWIAGRSEVTCGLLSSLTCVALGVYGLLGGGDGRLPVWVQLSSLFLSPFLGRLGGLLRKAAVERRARSRAVGGASAA